MYIPKNTHIDLELYSCDKNNNNNNEDCGICLKKGLLETSMATLVFLLLCFFISLLSLLFSPFFPFYFHFFLYHFFAQFSPFCFFNSSKLFAFFFLRLFFRSQILDTKIRYEKVQKIIKWLQFFNSWPNCTEKCFLFYFIL